MKLGYLFKIGIYNLSTTYFGKLLMKFFGKFVYVPNLRRTKTKGKHKFIISITIDTESGYLENNNLRVWQKDDPKAYVGYYKGIENWLSVLNKHNAKATFFLSTNCFSAENPDLKKIKSKLNNILKNGHEIGLHLHPDSDLTLQKLMGRKFGKTSSLFYDSFIISKMLQESKEILEKNTKSKVLSFRWGNWALSTKVIVALEKNAILIDSSATPGICGHENDGMHYDWSKVQEHYPWFLSKKNYQSITEQDSRILEMPIATFRLFGNTLMADPVYTELLKSAFDYYYENADRSEKDFPFVVISHSIEGIYKDGSKTELLKHVDEFIAHAKKFDNVEFKSINYFLPKRKT